MAGKESFILGDGERIAKLIVRHGDIVDSIVFAITDKNGQITTKTISDTTTGKICTEIVLGPEEYITRITGTYASYFGPNYVSTITFYTNSNQYGPYGTGANAQVIETFSTPQLVEGGTIIGFFGSSFAPEYSTPYVNSVGVYVKYGPYGQGQPSVHLNTMAALAI